MSDKDVGTLISAVFAILYLVICGHLGAHVAIEKGRGWVEGAVFGVLLGPLGAIVMALMPTLKAREPKPRQLAPERSNGDLIDDALLEKVADFIERFENLFDADWSHTKRVLD